MAQKIRVLHYLNQFFGGIGAEEHANVPVEVREGPVGPGRLLEQVLNGQGEVVATVLCGDNYAVEEQDKTLSAIGKALDQYRPDVVLAGPAFDAGRYGLACALVCRKAKEKGIPAVTGMHPDNTGVLTYRRDLIVVPTGAEASEMRSDLSKMAVLGIKLGRGEALGPALEEGYLPRGFRHPLQREEIGAERAFDMLVERVAGRPFTSEVQIQDYDAVAPAPLVPDLAEATIALVSTGGLVPKGNPDGQVGGRSNQYFRYSIEGLSSLSTTDWESVHMGFSARHLNERDPGYALPLSTVRELESDGTIKGIYPYFFSTTGNGMAVSVARQMGEEIGRELKEAGVDAALLVAT